MFKTLFLVVLMAISSGALLCQSLTGTVYDENNNVMPGVSVYFNGTSIGTITDENGKFKISKYNIINSSLIIGSLGYQSVAIKNPFEISDIQIYLKPKLIELPEVFVNGKKSNNRERYLNIFRVKFLGTSKGGMSCKIKNEEDIILKFDEQTNTLYASAYKPIIIENPFLGYLINFYPVNCNIKFEKTGVITRNVPGEYYFLGTVYFTDIGNNHKATLRRRNLAYEGSKMHFFRNFYNNIWTPDEFLLYRKGTPSDQINPNECFEITDTSGLKKIRVIDTDSTEYGNKSGNGKESFSESLNILYDRWASTEIIFKTKILLVDKFGNYDPLDKIEFKGAMTEKRIGDSLPLDFKLK